jgi:hypothetical protein
MATQVLVPDGTLSNSGWRWIATGGFTDNFNRADGALGAPWTTFTSYPNAPTILSNALRTNHAGAYSNALLDPASFSYPPDQWVEATVASIVNDTWIGLGVRMSLNGTGEGVYVKHNQLALSNIVNGVEGTTDLYTIALTVGDVLRLEATGTTIRALINGTPIGTRTATVSSGNPGVVGWGGSGITLDNLVTSGTDPAHGAVSDGSDSTWMTGTTNGSCLLFQTYETSGATITSATMGGVAMTTYSSPPGEVGWQQHDAILGGVLAAGELRYAIGGVESSDARAILWAENVDGVAPVRTHARHASGTFYEVPPTGGTVSITLATEPGDLVVMSLYDWCGDTNSVALYEGADLALAVQADSATRFRVYAAKIATGTSTTISVTCAANAGDWHYFWGPQAFALRPAHSTLVPRLMTETYAVLPSTVNPTVTPPPQASVVFTLSDPDPAFVSLSGAELTIRARIAP